MKIKTMHFESGVEINNSETSKAVKDALPIEGTAQCWQEEVYFEIPVEEKAQDRKLMTARVNQGDVAYWPPGKCFCVFYGKTQPVSEVMIIGKIRTNLEKFSEVLDGEKIILE
jgi:hypothetical protein